MAEYRSAEELEHASAQAQPPEKEEYVPRPRWQAIPSPHNAAGAVLCAFLGVCYWLAFWRA